MSPHLRRRRDLHEGSRNSAAGSGAAAAALDLSSSGAAVPRSNSGSHGSGAGFGAVRRQGSGIDSAKDKSAPHSLAGGTQAFQEAGQGGSDSPKIGAYHGPISSITKHYFMVRLRQMWCMRAAPTGHLLMCGPCRQAAPAATCMCSQLPVSQQWSSLLRVSACCITLLGVAVAQAPDAALQLASPHTCHADSLTPDTCALVPLTAISVHRPACLLRCAVL